jgi:NAD(P) transhydrogenase subunit alpha
MSGTNAIHGIVLVGAIIVAGLPDQVTWIRVVALTAVALGTINVVGGFVVTDRMLGMFKGRRRDAEGGDGTAADAAAKSSVRDGGRVERVRGSQETSPTQTEN